MSYLKHLFLVLALAVTTLATETIYFLPKDSNVLKEDIVKLINGANKSIDIAMYNFSYKKFAKELNNVSKKGIETTIIYGKSDLKFYEKIDLKTTKRKLHTKFAIIDDSVVIFGSSNWTKKSFSKNYEVVHVSYDKSTIDKYKTIFKMIKEDN